jgi:putative membrane protein
MALRWLLAAAHLLALGIGLGAIWARARALRAVTRGTDPTALGRALVADSWWGVAGALWIGTGLWRLFAGTEKASGYYYGNHLFWTKMALLGTLVVLEIVVVRSLTGWRIAVGRGERPALEQAARLAPLSYVQVALVILMLLAAAGMARGLGAAGMP